MREKNDRAAFAVVTELARQGKTVATAESCTGGLLAKRITDVPGASAVFGYGLVTYANAAKVQLLRVPEAMLAAHGAVSPEVACRMAQGARAVAHADFGIGITGVAGPDGGTALKPVGLVYIALADVDHTWLRALRPHGKYPGREKTRHLAANHALNMLRRRLRGQPPA